MKKLFLILAMITSSAAIAQADRSTSFQYSEQLSQAGEKAKRYIAKEFKRINEVAKQQGSNIQYIVVDAQDPRLYPNGAPYQPNSPADRVVVKVADNGDWVPTALIQNQPGYYAYKNLNGQKIYWFGYNNRRIEYRTATQGLVASVIRNRSVYGFTYINYLRGYGNRVSSAMLDQAILDYLDDLVYSAVTR